MKMQPTKSKSRFQAGRRGFSLLELTVTTGLMATIVTSSFVLLRTSQSAWTAFKEDQDRLEMAHAVVRHIVRKVRQADQVTSITPPNNPNGRLTVRMSDGTTCSWDRTSTRVDYTAGGTTSLLANYITGLSFTGYKADGVTATTTEADIQSVVCTVTVSLPRGNGVTKTISCRAWRRAWL